MISPSRSYSSPGSCSTITALVLLACLSFGCDPATTSDAGATPDARIAIDVGGLLDAPPPAPPTVVSVTPTAGATEVPINTAVTATFSAPMDRATLTGATFTLTGGTPAVAIAGTVVYAGTTATFWPASRLETDTMLTATITTGATSAAGVALASLYTWRFTTGNTSAAGLPVALGTAGDFVILAKTGVSTVPTSAVTGDVGLSPAAATFITGFSLTADATGTFSTSPQVTGRVYAADSAVPTPGRLTTAVADMELAFTDAAGRAPDVTELGAGNVGGMTLARGVYAWGTGLLVPSDVTLTGTATDVWIFQVGGDLTMESAARIVLSGGALPENVFWQVAGRVDLGTTAHVEGTILSMTSITLHTGATANGRLLAQSAVVLDGSTVVEPD